VSDGRRRSISWRRHIDWKTNQASDSAHGLVLTLVSQFGYTQCQIRVATCRVTLSMLLLCVACFFCANTRPTSSMKPDVLLLHYLSHRRQRRAKLWLLAKCSMQRKIRENGTAFPAICLSGTTPVTYFLCLHAHICLLLDDNDTVLTSLSHGGGLRYTE